MIINGVLLLGLCDFLVDPLEQVSAAIIVLGLGVSDVGVVRMGGSEHINIVSYFVGWEWIVPGDAADVAETIVVVGVA